MSIYYHEFVPDIFGNMWFYLGIASLVISFILGEQRFYVVHDRWNERLKKRQRYQMGFIQLIVSILTVTFMLMLLLESGTGIVQMFDNSLSKYESGVWSLIFMPLTVMAAGMIFYAVMMAVAEVGTRVRLWRIRKFRKEFYRKQRAEKGEAEKEQSCSTNTEIVPIRRFKI